MNKVALSAGLAVPLLISQAIMAAPKPAAGPKPVAAVQAPQAKPEEPQKPDFPKMIGGGVAKSVALLQSSAVTFTSRQACTSCHHQILAAATVDMARQFGFKVNEAQAKSEADNFAAELARFKGPLL